jgi:hypothetical protein
MPVSGSYEWEETPQGKLLGLDRARAKAKLKRRQGQARMSAWAIADITEFGAGSLGQVAAMG